MEIVKYLPIILWFLGFSAIIVGQFVMVKPDFSETQWASMLLGGMIILNAGLIIWTINYYAKKQEKVK